MNSHSSWLAEPLGADRLSLLCFPHAGAGTLAYKDWDIELPPNISVCPVRLPGREQRISEPVFRRIPALIDALVDDVVEKLRSPFAVFGHSLGALLAFEFARGLRRTGGPEPVLLAVSGRPSPTFPDERERLHDRPDAHLIRHLRRLGGTPSEVFNHPDLIALLLRAVRADFEMLETWVYSPEPALDCPIYAWAGSDDPLAPPASVMGWRELTWSTFAFHELPGDHFFVFPQRRTLLRTLAEALRESC